MIGDEQGNRPWVYYAKSSGLFRRIHRASGVVLIALMLVAPWVRIGGNPLLRVDFTHHLVSVFGANFTALDTRFLLVLALILAIGLGFFTALLGRLWCGYMCPQTVFLEEVVRRIETWLEGDRGARRKLDKSPWTARKIRIKVSKWTLFAVVCFLVAMTVVAYFVDPRLLWSGGASTQAYIAVASATAALFVDFVWFREQFCNYICPYARIQGALTDEHSLVIGYDVARGEPRMPNLRELAKAERKEVRDEILARGSCTDCNRCVAVCPQGIDIRHGFQLECIACGHCIDACTEVLAKHDKPSLIVYSTEAKLAGKPTKILRARPAVYGALLLVLVIAAVLELNRRTSSELTITRTAGTSFVTENERVRNMYDVHLFNNQSDEQLYTLTLEGIDAQLVVTQPQLLVPARSDILVSVMVLAELDTLSEPSTPMTFVLVPIGDDDDAETIRRQATFLAPVGSR